MEIMYKAFDGTYFDNEFDCQEYEWKQKHRDGFRNLILYDKDENILEDIMSEETYGKTMHIEILSQEALQALQDLADYTGFCAYDDVDDIGDWYWKGNELEGWFEKIKE